MMLLTIVWRAEIMESVQALSTAPDTLAFDTVREWILWMTEVERRMGSRFPRRDLRRRVRAYLRGLLSPVERKNGWQLAEINGDSTPYGVQHLLGRARWDAEAVRDDLRPYVIEHLGTPQGVLVIDETGFLKKGRASAGVARQYSGTAGRIDNCQIGVFLAYASARGQALLDRELYLPKAWTGDRPRCERAGIPPTRPFATKPELARQMLERTLSAGVPAAWVTGDSVYGDDRRLRMWLESQERAYVLAVSGKEYVWLGWHQRQVKTVLAALVTEGWARLSAGDGAKGPRWYDWIWLPLAAPWQPDWCRWLLVRRSLSDPTELTAYVVFAPHETTLATVVQVAGSRWTIEQCFEEAKGEVGLDQYEVRSWVGWYRHITLAMWAYALLTVLRVANLPQAPPSKKIAQGSALSSLTAFKRGRGLACR
jgi:SRSO17 transposase